ncbi:MAG: helix-turn-helix domain-containing protein [Kiloniellales bacterium]|nr:helix-turn-helix domain-containing protein [Kiloniellales bacterium]
MKTRQKSDGVKHGFVAGVSRLAGGLTQRTRIMPLREARRCFEEFYIRYVVALCAGNRREAAQRLGIGYSTLKDKVRAAPLGFFQR